MDYNTERPKLTLPEYGRNVQKMVDYALTIADRDERQRCAESIISIMAGIFPQQSGTEDFERMLWDHLALISGYKLDVSSPYPINVLVESNREHPHLDYPGKKITYRHYGHILEESIHALTSMAEGDQQQQATEIVVEQMAKSLATWNDNVLTPAKLAADLSELTEGKVQLSLEPQVLDNAVATARAGGKSANFKKKKK